MTAFQSFIASLIGAAGGGIVVTLGAVAWLFNIGQKHFLERARLAIEYQFNSNLERVKKELTIELERYKAGAPGYDEIWQSLVALQERAEALWQRATVDRLAAFKEQLDKTRTTIRRYAYVLRRRDVDSLVAVLEQFDMFSVGKAGLLREVTSDYYDPVAVHATVTENGAVRERYLALQEDILAAFRASRGVPE